MDESHLSMWGYANSFSFSWNTFFSHKQHHDFFDKIFDAFPSLWAYISILMPFLYKIQKSKCGLYAKASRGSLAKAFPVYLEEAIEHESIKPIWGKSSPGGKLQMSGCCTLHYSKTLNGWNHTEWGSAEIHNNCSIS